MPNKLYDEFLLQSTKQLKDFSLQLFSTLINVAMSGELKNINDDLAYGSEVVFNDIDFRQVEDENVKLLYAVLDVIQHVKNGLINNNNLSIDIGETGST